MSANCEPYRYVREDGHEFMVCAAEFHVRVGATDLPGRYNTEADARTAARRHSLDGRPTEICRTALLDTAVDLTRAVLDANCPACERDTVWTPFGEHEPDAPHRIKFLERAGKPTDRNDLCRNCDDEAFADHYRLPVKKVKRQRDTTLGRDGWGLAPRPPLPRRSRGDRS